MRTRPRRVASEIARLLNELLLTEVKDPRLDGVRVNEVEVSGDLGVAKVWFGTLDPDRDASDAAQALESAKGFLRTRVGRALQVRRVPELRFFHDVRTRREFEVRRLIDSTRPARDDDDDSGE